MNDAVSRHSRVLALALLNLSLLSRRIFLLLALLRRPYVVQGLLGGLADVNDVHGGNR